MPVGSSRERGAAQSQLRRGAVAARSVLAGNAARPNRNDFGVTGVTGTPYQLHDLPLSAYSDIPVRLLRQSIWRPCNPPHPACRENLTAPAAFEGPAAPSRRGWIVSASLRDDGWRFNQRERASILQLIGWPRNPQLP